MNFGYPSSVNDELKSGFNIYPNPSEGIFTIENLNNENVIYSVRNILGQITYSESLNSISKSTVDLSHLGSGVYTIEFDGKAKKYNQKLVIE